MRRRDLLKALPVLLIPAIIPAIPEKKRIKLGSGDYLEYTPQGIDFGKDDYTIEFWLKTPHVSDVRVTRGVARYKAAFPEIQTKPDNEWHHYAVVQKDGEKTHYRDGEKMI